MLPPLQGMHGISCHAVMGLLMKHFTSTLKLWIKCTQHLSTVEACLKIARARNGLLQDGQDNTQAVMCTLIFDICCYFPHLLA